MTEMKPALTAEEWKKAFNAKGEPVINYPEERVFWHASAIEGDADDCAIAIGDSDRQRVAAMCLFGQPFGFTREDVKNLNFVLKRLNGLISDDRFARLGDLSDRISALLPPEEQERA
jgi:hypothetical protein